jgi:hypothetical protein
MLSRLLVLFRIGILVVILLLVLFPILVVFLIILWIVDFPNKIGHQFEFESSFRKLLFRFFDPIEMRSMRDEMLHLIEGSIEVEADADRWGLLRDIENAQLEINKRLKNGEFVFSFVCGIIALGIGTVYDAVYLGVFLTAITLLFSILVSARLIITEALCYRSIRHRYEPIERLCLYRGWNRGPIFGTGAIAIALVSAVLSRKGEGYKFGKVLLELILVWQYEFEDKWRVSSRENTE